MLVDDVKINVTAGRGGDGVVAFNRNKMELGPTGGDGGRGGCVYVKGVPDIGALKRFRYKKDIKAEDGKDGRSQFRDGSEGEDVFLRVPVGTVITRGDGKFFGEIENVGEEVVIAKGGRGGRGNFKFRSSTNTSPKEYEEGDQGEEASFHFELKLIADVGFVGLPNVGKSSLLNELTNAKSKVANYRFTTLEPHLGVYYDLILADIPGLISGASEGKGLGIKFLRHVERTKLLFHFIAADSKDHLLDYNTVRSELKKHKEELLEKKEYIIISKKDNVSKEKLSSIEKEMKKRKKDVYSVSILDDQSMQEVKNLLSRIANEK